MPRFRGVGDRMRTRLRGLGYVKPSGELRVSDFCMDHRYHPTMFYDWLADRRTPIKDLPRLAQDLATTESYLLFGVETPLTPSVGPPGEVHPHPARRTGPRRLKPIRGGSDAAPPPAVRASERECALSDVRFHPVVWDPPLAA
jgi:hypothetical protein